MASVEQIVERMKSACSADNDIKLAEYLGISATSTISSWKKRESRPYAYCEVIADCEGVTMDWLLTGQGIKYWCRSSMRDDLSVNDTVAMVQQLDRVARKEVLSRVVELL